VSPLESWELLLALGLLWIVLALIVGITVGITVGRAAALRERRDRPGAEIVPLRPRRHHAPGGGEAA
jgi:hypothetical protein